MQPTDPSFVVEYGVAVDFITNPPTVFNVDAGSFAINIGDVVCCEKLG